MQHSLEKIRKALGLDIPTGLSPKDKKAIIKIIKLSEHKEKRKKVGRPSFEEAAFYKKVDYKTLRHKKPKAGFIPRSKKHIDVDLKNTITAAIENKINELNARNNNR